MKENPCKSCTTETGRHPGCHDTCEKYQESRKRYVEEQEKIHKKREAHWDLNAPKYKHRQR